MTQKAKKTTTTNDILKRHQVQNRQLYALNRIGKTPAIIGSNLLGNYGGSGGGLQSASGNYLKTQGDTMVGPIAYFPATVAINASDEIDLTPANTSTANASSYVILSFTSPDSLELISGAQFDGQQLQLQVPASSTLTVEDYSSNVGGNIVTGDGNDIVITTSSDPIPFTIIFDASLSPNSNNGGWVILGARSITGGTSTASFPLNYPVDDAGTIGSVTVNHDLNGTDAHKLRFTANGDVNINIDNVPSGGANAIDFYVEVTQDSTGGHDVNFDATTEMINPPTLSSTADTTSLIACHADGNGNIRAVTLLNASPSSGNFANQQLSNLSSVALNTDLGVNGQDITAIDKATWEQDSNSITGTAYQIVVASDLFISNVPLNQEWSWREAGIEKWRMSDTLFSGANITLSESFSLNDSSTNPTVAGEFRQNAGDVLVYTGGSALNLSNIDIPLTTKGDLLGYDTGNARIPVGSNGQVLVADSTDAQGIVWGTVDNITENDSNVTVTDTGSGLITHTVDATTVLSLQQTRIDVENLPVFGVTELNFYDLVDAATALSITQNTADVTFNLPVNSDVYNFEFNSAIGVKMDLLRTTFYSNTPNTISPAIRLYRDDPSSADDDVVGDINFTGNTAADAGIFTYADIIGVAADVTDTTEDGRVRIRTAINGVENKNALTIEGPVTTIHQDSSVGTDVAALKLMKTDATPLVNEQVGQVQFVVDDSGIETTYSSLTGLTNTDTGTVTDAGALNLNIRTNGSLSVAASVQGNNNSELAQWLMLGETRIQPITGNMGYFTATQVTDFSVNIGTEGTIQIPFINDGSPSLTDLNSSFGAYDGAIGVDINNNRLYVRISSSTWAYYTNDGTVT